MNETTPLQGCKYLVELGTPLGLLTECGVSYCELADIANSEQCVQKMTNQANNVNNWINYYCEAVMNNPKSPDTAPASENDCKKTVRKEGWPTATALYGQGHKDLTVESGECGNNIKEYAVSSSEPQCEQGVAIEVLDEKTDTWETIFFIPVSKPLCGDMVEISYKAATKKLFSHQVRVTQCDAKMNDARCAAVSTCAPSYGAKFRMSFSSSVTDIGDLLDQGYLQCVDKEMPDGTISNTWCFPDSMDYTPIDKVCPCPSRRVLEEQLFLGKN